MRTKIAIATGDPRGIGPEVSLKAALDPKVRALCHPEVIGSGAAIKAHAQACGLSLRNVELLELGPGEFTIGEIRPAHGRAAIAAAQRAIPPRMWAFCARHGPRSTTFHRGTGDALRCAAGRLQG